ncbi:histidine--tRNA ligase [Saccharomycopsis crataegensis]|uniref:Histidine--tRNA ligase, mitochondrial n=1 Tax=Saccharomycopsis crataegensis TaxID=43959 RepID=A0AAV5QT45_9ASCO|nr:histidine--tRNA ligase [Saccharomycopsis crataegensis]
MSQATNTSVPPAATAAAAPNASKKSKKSKDNFQLKTPKGTKDWSGKDMILRESIFNSLSSLFKRHGGVTIDTPVFELTEILTGKYGEDSKLIYNLQDQGGELASLRYDLTVPFARFVAMNNVQNIKRYHIAKVYRRDQPAMTKGRMREFYQCDFDVAGQYDTMVPDSEILAILVEGLTGLGIKEFKIKINHRKVLDGIFKVCGVKDEDVRKISSAVDKLDKSPWEAVKKEMVEEKGQTEEVAEKIGSYVKLNGSISEMAEKLGADELLLSDPSAKEGIEEMKILAEYTAAFDIHQYLSFDLSLARGLDYYTGLIYEAVTDASKAPENAQELKKKASKKGDVEDASEYVGVGSIAAGGRYDNLVNMFASATGKKNVSIPCVGISFGVERIFSLMKARNDLMDKIRSNSTQVYIMAFGDGYLSERMKIAKELWANGIECEYLYKAKAKTRPQFTGAERSGAPVAVIIGKDEVASGKVRIKKLNQGEDADEGELVDLKDVATAVKSLLTKLNAGSSVDEIAAMIKGL